jgi:hypothetical protein
MSNQLEIVEFRQPDHEKTRNFGYRSSGVLIDTIVIHYTVSQFSSAYKTPDDFHKRIPVRAAQIPRPVISNPADTLHIRGVIRRTVTSMHNARYGPPRYHRYDPNRGPQIGNLVYKRIDNVPGVLLIC